MAEKEGMRKSGKTEKDKGKREEAKCSASTFFLFTYAGDLETVLFFGGGDPKPILNTYSSNIREPLYKMQTMFLSSHLFPQDLFIDDKLS